DIMCGIPGRWRADCYTRRILTRPISVVSADASMIDNDSRASGLHHETHLAHLADCRRTGRRSDDLYVDVSSGSVPAGRIPWLWLGPCLFWSRMGISPGLSPLRIRVGRIWLGLPKPRLGLRRIRHGLPRLWPRRVRYGLPRLRMGVSRVLRHLDQR